MSKVVTNADYRKSRGTDKPFNGSEEQTQAIWNESIRKDKRTFAQRTPGAGSTPESGAVNN